MKMFATVVSLLLAGVANAAIITFDSAPVGSANPITIDGFRFVPGSGNASPGSSITDLGQRIIVESAGDNALSVGALARGSGIDGSAGGISLTMTALDGNAFAFYGADFSTSAAYNFYGGSGINGQKVGGGYASGPIGSGDWLNLQSLTFSFAGGFDYLEGYPLGGISFTVDNVNAQVVPLPPAVWLFASALAGLGWLRRQQTI